MVWRVFVLPRMDDPGHPSLPGVGPERRDEGHAIRRRRVEEPEREVGGRRDAPGRFIRRGGRIGQEDVGAAQRRPPVRASLLVNRHRRVRRDLRCVGDDHLLSSGGRDRDVDADEGRRAGEERPGREDDERRGDRPVVRLDGDDPPANRP